MGASAFASGEDTYKAVCANCHSKAFANSPQMGDTVKWASLIAEAKSSSQLMAMWAFVPCRPKVANQI